MELYQGMTLIKEGKEGTVIDTLNGVAIILWDDHKVEEWLCFGESDLLDE